jgi:hypothetical protein
MVNRCVIPGCDQPAWPPGRCPAHQQALARAVATLWDLSPAGAAERATCQARAATPTPGSPAAGLAGGRPGGPRHYLATSAADQQWPSTRSRSGETL